MISFSSIIYYDLISKRTGIFEKNEIILGENRDGKITTRFSPETWMPTITVRRNFMATLSARNLASSYTLREYIKANRYTAANIGIDISKLGNWIDSNYSIASLFGITRGYESDKIRIPITFPLTILLERIPDRSSISKSIVIDLIASRGPTPMSMVTAELRDKTVAAKAITGELVRLGFLSERNGIVYPGPYFTGVLSSG